MRFVFFCTCFLFTSVAPAQILNVSAGTDLTVLGGTIFRADSLMLTPSSNYIISNNTLTKSFVAINTISNTYISRVYHFTNSTNPYTGSLQLYYADGTQLNGISEAALTLNIHNGTSWVAFPAPTRDATNNFILTNGLSAVNFNELTLANLLTTLPLTWLSFNATRQNQTVLLQWATSQEENTRNFTLQHSKNGIEWAAIGILAAAGSSSSIHNYSFVHTAPLTGTNYYRLLQTDMDSRASYSNIKAIRFTKTEEPFIITGNPVVNNILTLQVNTACDLDLYSTDGKLLWKEKAKPGTKYIDVSRYTKGAYILKSNSSMQKVMIQ